jgi:hypothetical protein
MFTLNPSLAASVTAVRLPQNAREMCRMKHDK